MTDEPLGQLIASAQSALADVPHVTDYRAKRVLIQSARVQAACALALAVEHLATTVDRLVEPKETA
jgi:predicted metal-dependent hydrolase